MVEYNPWESTFNTKGRLLLELNTYWSVSDISDTLSADVPV